MSDFHFIRPYWLFALLPAFFLLAVMLKNRLKQGRWAEVCDAELLPFILQERETLQNRWPLLAGFAAAFLAIFALAGPTWERLPTPIFRDDSALVIVLDLSRSMDAADIKPSRLIRARYKVTDILKLRKEGLTALIAYAGDAFMVTPLTDDVETIASQLNALKTEIMPVQGSNAGRAVKMAGELLQQSGLQAGDILLITDGLKSDSVGAIAKEAGSYRLSVLGVGTEEGAPIGLVEGGFLKDSRGNIVVPKLDSDPLSALASAGGGFYKTITIDDGDIDAIMAELKEPLADLSSRENEGFLDQWDEKGPWLLLLVLPLGALFFRRGLLSLAFILLLPFPQKSEALDWQSLWKTEPQQGQTAFNNQQFEAAAEKFQSPERRAAAQYRAENYEQAAKTLESVDTADGHYNRGNALASSGQLEAAKRAYQRALELNPDDKDIQHNKKQIEEALKELQENPQEQPESNGEESPEQGDEQESQGSDKRQDGADEQPSPANEKESGEQDESAHEGAQEQQDESPSESGGEQQKAPQVEENRQNEAPQSERRDDSEERADSTSRAEKMSEEQQANEQWLKRIPDDPAGLLKRKFRYQYGRRRGGQVEQEQTW